MWKKRMLNVPPVRTTYVDGWVRQNAYEAGDSRRAPVRYRYTVTYHIRGRDDRMLTHTSVQYQ